MTTVGAAQNRPSDKKATEAKADESLLAREVRHQVQVLPYYSVFDYIHFTLTGSTVTLEGQVLRPTLKESAEAAVKTIEGITAVVNRIEVLPKSATDDELRREIYRAVFEDTSLQRYAAQAVPSIHIVVKNGVVTLEGTVANEADKALAAKRAASVSGVTHVESHLLVGGA